MSISSMSSVSVSVSSSVSVSVSSSVLEASDVSDCVDDWFSISETRTTYLYSHINVVFRASPGDCCVVAIAEFLWGCYCVA